MWRKWRGERDENDGWSMGGVGENEKRFLGNDSLVRWVDLGGEWV